MRLRMQELNAYAIVKNTNGEFLILKRKNNIWEFPGGGVEWGEDPSASAKRETEEETGLKVKIENLLCVSSATFGKGNDEKHAVYACYLAIPLGEADVRISGEHESFTWVKKKDLKTYKLGLNCLPVLKHL